MPGSLRCSVLEVALLVVAVAAAPGSAWATAQGVPPPAALAPAAPGPVWEPTQPSATLPPPSQLLPPRAELPTVSGRGAVGSGTAWRTFLAYRRVLHWAGGMVLGLVAVLLLGHFAVYGFHHLAATGRRVPRYRTVEVALHAVLALSFVAAWASATYLVLAKHVLRSAERPAPVPLGHLASTAHIGAGVAFLAALVALGVLWRPAMRFAAHDREWLRVLGGYFSRTHRIVPAGRFNAGQKLWFRLLIPVGVLLSVSGALLYYPAWLGVGPGIAFYVVHTALAVFVSAAVIGHVYLGAVVHPHAVRGMVTGEVDEACLREDHPLEAPGSHAA